jgi:sugar lactone lactonase YvrE
VTPAVTLGAFPTQKVWLYCISLVLLGASLRLAALHAQTLPEAPGSPLAIRPTDRIRGIVDDQVTVVLSGNRHPRALPENDLGPVPKNFSMGRMILVLKSDPAQQAALDSLLAGQINPASPYYHKWLTPEEFGAHFGASEHDLAEVVSWLRRNGITPEPVDHGRRSIVFRATAGQVERAFHTQIHRYRVRGELHYANATDPQIPQALAGVVSGAVSLHDFRPRPAHQIAARGVVYGTNYNLAPADYATIYDINPLYSNGINGARQTIAIVGVCNINTTDVATFRTLTGLVANTPTTILSGTPDQCTDPAEAYLDVEWAGAVARNAAIVLVASDTINDSANDIVQKNLAPVMSTSFGACEADLGTSGNLFWSNTWSQAAGQGITSVVASGDSGAAGCDMPTESVSIYGRAVNGICSTPYNLCVGGTEFDEDYNYSLYWNSSTSASLGSALGYIPEVAWNESGTVPGGSGLYASGGGVSTVNPHPSWQPGNSMRTVPDVALTAAQHDAYLICEANCTSTNFTTIYGTSAAAPSFAGLMALVVQSTGQRQGLVNPNIYKIYNQDIGSGFNLIFDGNNSVPGVVGYSADVNSAGNPGYPDLVTGFGSVDFTSMVDHWTNQADFDVFLYPGSLTIPGGLASGINLAVESIAGFNSTVTLSCSGLPSGASCQFPQNPAPAGTYTIQIITTPGTPAGTTTLTVTGVSGIYTHTTTAGLTVLAEPYLNIALTHAGNFVQGQTGAVYSIVVGNTGTLPTNGTVMVTGSLPAGLTATTISGTGWSCTLSTSSWSCTTSSVLKAGASYPAITVTVNVSGNAPPTVTTVAAVSGGGESSAANGTVSNPTTILQTTTLALAVSPSSSTLGRAVTLTARPTSSPSNATGTVVFYDQATFLGVGAFSGGQATFTTTLLSAGKHSLTAFAPGSSTFPPSISPAVPLTVVTVAGSGFVTAANYNVGANPVVGDFNGDGIPDLAVVSGSNVNVLLGNGDGTFKTAVPYAADAGQIAVGDFNGDGQADLVVTTATGVSVLLGNGDGTFQSPVPSRSGGYPYALAVGDFNGDGKLDVVVSDSISGSYSSSQIAVLLGNGDGTFQAPILGEVVSLETSFAVADFNGDGKADLALIQPLGPVVVILLGNGDGTFETFGAAAGISSSVALTVGDFNGDGRPDVAGINPDGSVSVVLSNSNGTFQTPVTLADNPPYYAFNALAASDFNGDGKLDLVVGWEYDFPGSGNPISYYLTTLLGNGQGGLSPLPDYPLGAAPTALAVADFNGDGIADLAVGNGGGVSILLGLPKYASATLTTSPPGLQVVVDGTYDTTPQTLSWTPGSSHTLYAPIQAGSTGVQYVFSSWSNGGSNPQTVSPNFAATYAATFNTQYELTTAVNNSAGGSVSPVCPTTHNTGTAIEVVQCFYNSGTSVNLQATPSSGYMFTGWSGSVTGATNPLSLTMAAPMTVTANFALQPNFSISVSPASQTVTQGGSTTYTVNTATTTGSPETVYLSALAAPGTTVSFNPFSVTSGGSTTLTISTSSSTPVGTFQLTVAGFDTFDNLHSVTVGLTVVPPIALAPAIATVPAVKTGLGYPFGLASDGAGNLYIGNYYGLVVQVSPLGLATTFAGGGGTAQDGVAPTATSMRPYGVTTDSAGNVYIADAANNAVRVVNTQASAITLFGKTIQPGQIQTVAGTLATAGFDPTHLNFPGAIALDGAGNLWIADTNNNAIRKVTPNGDMTTVVNSSGQFGGTGDGGLATSAQLASPYGVALDAHGNLFIADFNNHVVRAVNTNPSGTGTNVVFGTNIAAGNIATVAGINTGTCGYSGDGGAASSANLCSPVSLALDATGSLWISDYGDNAVRFVNALTGDISTVAGSSGVGGYSGDGGLATSAQLSNPIGLTLDASGNLYVADFNNNLVREIYTGAGFPPTEVGAGSVNVNVLVQLNQNTALSRVGVTASPGGATEFAVGTTSGCSLSGSTTTVGTICTISLSFHPAYPGVRRQQLVLTDSNGNQYSFGLSGVGLAPQVALIPGTISTIAGNGSNAPSTTPMAATSISLGSPEDLAFDSAGNLYIAELIPFQLLKMSGGNITQFAPASTFAGPDGIAVDGAGNVYVSENNDCLIKKVSFGSGAVTVIAGTTCGSSSGDGQPAAQAMLSAPASIASTPAGDLYVVDGYAVRKIVAATGLITTVAGVGSSGYSGDGGPATLAGVSPNGLALDSAGNLYIADSSNCRVRKVAFNSGVISTAVGNGACATSGDGGLATSASVNGPYAVAVDAASNLYVAEFGGNVIRKVDAATGIISTIAGTGTANTSGDGGPATSAALFFPIRLTVDPAGNLFFISRGLIRSITATAAPQNFPTTAVGNTSPTQTVKLSNIGNQPLALSGVSVGALYVQETVTGTNCTSLTVPPGSSCLLGLAFAPTGANGTKSATATIVDNAQNVIGASQTVNLQGTDTGGTTPSATAFVTAPTASTYGQSVSFTAAVTANSAAVTTGSVTFTDTTNNATLSSVLAVNSSGQASFSTSSLGVGSHVIQASYSGTTSFASGSATTTITVGKAALTVTANGQTITYGSAPAAFTAAITGFVNGDTSAVVSGAASFATSATLTNGKPNAGSWTITPSVGTLSATNYTFGAGTTYATGTLTVSKASLAVTANSSSTLTNATLPVLTATMAGLVNSDIFSGSTNTFPIVNNGDTLAGAVTGAVSLATTATSSSVAGSYPINAGSAGLGLSAGNYTISFVPGILTVTPSTRTAFSAVAINFGSQAVGVASASQTVTVTNIGTNSLTVGNVAASGDFLQTNTCTITAVAASGTCTITVTFSPTASGLRSGAISITDNASNGPQTIRLSGVGIAGSAGASISLSAIDLNFSAQTVNTTSAAKTVTLTNSGGAAVTVNNISANGNFAQTNNCSNVAASATCTINVSFTPLATGALRGSIVIMDNATGAPQVIRLLGTGNSAAAPAIGLSNVSLNFGNQKTGAPSSAQTIIVTNTGSAPLTITGIATTGDFGASGCVTSLPAGAACTLSVTFTPTVTGARHGTIALTDNAAGSPQVIQLFGNGT